MKITCNGVHIPGGNEFSPCKGTAIRFVVGPYNTTLAYCMDHCPKNGDSFNNYWREISLEEFVVLTVMST
jgi:hypothetical protein